MERGLTLKRIITSGKDNKQEVWGGKILEGKKNCKVIKVKFESECWYNITRDITEFKFEIDNLYSIIPSSNGFLNNTGFVALIWRLTIFNPDQAKSFLSSYIPGLQFSIECVALFWHQITRRGSSIIKKDYTIIELQF